MKKLSLFILILLSQAVFSETIIVYKETSVKVPNLLQDLESRAKEDLAESFNSRHASGLKKEELLTGLEAFSIDPVNRRLILSYKGYKVNPKQRYAFDYQGYIPKDANTYQLETSIDIDDELYEVLVAELCADNQESCQL